MGESKTERKKRERERERVKSERWSVVGKKVAAWVINLTVGQAFMRAIESII